MLRSAFSWRDNTRALFVPPRSHFTPIDGLRALSIVWVFAFHVIHMLGELMPAPEFAALLARPAVHFVFHGHYSVDVFFVISGFLIGNMLVAERDRTHGIDFKRFYYRRITRLCPVYFALMAAVIAGASLASVPLPVGTAWANFLYVNNFVPIHTQFMAWTWSLAIEEQFYMLCPLLVLWLPRRWALPALGALLLGALAIRYGVVISADPALRFVLSPALDKPAFQHFYDTLYDKTYTRFGGLLLGVAVAYLYRYTDLVARIARSPALGASLLAAALGIGAWLFTRFDYLAPDAASTPAFLTVERYAFSLAVALVVMLSLAPSGLGAWIGRALSVRAFFPLAQLSYSIYLTHPIVLFVAWEAWYKAEQRVPSGLELTLVGAASGVATLVWAALLYLLIEKPVLRLRG